MWQRMRPVVDGCSVVSLEETKRAMRLMAEKARMVSEGAGALPLAAALTGKAGPGPIVAIVSRGNIDLKKFAELIGSAAGARPSCRLLANPLRRLGIEPRTYWLKERMLRGATGNHLPT